jgi:hypothetical protein
VHDAGIILCCFRDIGVRALCGDAHCTNYGRTAIAATMNPPDGSVSLRGRCAAEMISLVTSIYSLVNAKFI